MLATARTRLDFTLRRTPDKNWGTAAADAPPSFGAGPVRFPPTTRASVSADPAARSGWRPAAGAHRGRRGRQLAGHHARDGDLDGAPRRPG